MNYSRTVNKRTHTLTRTHNKNRHLIKKEPTAEINSSLFDKGFDQQRVKDRQ